MNNIMSFWGSKVSWGLLISAILGDFIVAYILALFYPGYSHSKQVMSVLGNPHSPVATYLHIWLIVLGGLVCISAVNFYLTYSPVSKNLAGAGLVILIIFGVGAGILSGIFSVNETKEMETLGSKIHGIGAGIGFMALTFIPLIIGMLSVKSNDTAIGAVSFVSFVLSLIFFVLFIMSEKEAFQNTVIGLTGLWQRLLLGSMYVPLLLISLKNICNHQ
jgi:hypothetical protein